MVTRRRTITAALLVIGAEIVSGRVPDRNGGLLGARLTELGLEVITTKTVRDRRSEILRGLRHLRGERVDLIVVTGGLGSTPDDVTVAAVAEFARRPLIVDETVLEYLRAYPLRGSTEVLDAWHTVGERQTLVPMGALVVRPIGTAPGFVLPARPRERLPVVMCLPGPTEEVRFMFEELLTTSAVQKLLAGSLPLQRRVMRLLVGHDLDETLLGRTVSDALDVLGLGQLSVGTCIEEAGTELIVETTFPEGAEPEYLELERHLLTLHGAAVISLDSQTIEDLVRMLLGTRTVGVVYLTAGGLMTARLKRCARTLELDLDSGNTATEVAPDILALLDGYTLDARRLARRARELLGTEIGIGLLPAQPGDVDVAVSRPGRGGAATCRFPLPSIDDAAAITRSTADVLHTIRRLLLRELTSGTPIGGGYR